MDVYYNKTTTGGAIKHSGGVDRFVDADVYPWHGSDWFRGRRGTDIVTPNNGLYPKTTTNAPSCNRERSQFTVDDVKVKAQDLLEQNIP